MPDGEAQEERTVGQKGSLPKAATKGISQARKRRGKATPVPQARPISEHVPTAVTHKEAATVVSPPPSQRAHLKNG